LIIAGIAAWFLFAFTSEEPPRAPAETGGSVFRQQIMIRFPRGQRGAVQASSTMTQWRESRGPRCLSASRIVGATLLGQDSVDLILRDNRRVRARLESRCPALDFYRGFYVNATEDGQICADRDMLRSRAGGQCQIDQFRMLTALSP
jgi:hypothetical protein